MKRFLTLTLTIIMLFNIIPISAMVVNADTEGYYTYTVTDGKATITGFDSSVGGSVVIPSTLGGYPVSGIGNSAFYGCYGIESVKIPESVTIISDFAFSLCPEMRSIELPKNLTVIGNNVFENCYNLIDITIPEKVIEIGDSAFSNCAMLKSMILPESVINIGSHLFENCSNLTRVQLRGNVSVIEENTFSECYSLEDIYISSELQTIKKYAFNGCEGLLKVYFGGNEEKWGKVEILQGNTVLNNVKMYYDSVKIPVEVEYIEMYTLPEKLVFYEIVDELDVAGGKIKVYYVDGTSEIIAIDVSMVSGYDNNKVGEQSLIVTYGSAKTGYGITIISNSYMHNFENGLCVKCGAKQIIIKDFSFAEPPFVFENKYIYNTYSITDVNADGFYVNMMNYATYYDNGTIVYFYDDKYDIIGEYTAEYLKSNIISVSGKSVRIRLVSEKGNLNYNADVVAIYTFDEGDINGDFSFNASDLTFLKGALLNVKKVMPHRQKSADVNSDGKFNILDFVALKKLFLNSVN